VVNIEKLDTDNRKGVRLKKGPSFTKALCDGSMAHKKGIE
jgi:hypothetical protein